MSFIWALIVSIPVMAFIVVSMVANWTFGASQGSYEAAAAVMGWQIDSAHLFGFASLGADALKCLLLFGVTMAISRRAYGAACVVATIWLLCLGWSWTSAVGFVEINHQRMVDGADKAKDAWGDAKARMERLQAQRQLVPQHRELSIVRTDIANKKATNEWQWSEGCTDKMRYVNWCNGYRGLLAEEASASSADELDAKIEALRKERDGRSVVSVADPLAASLARLTSTDSGDVSKARAWFFGFFVEFITALGLWGIWRARGDAKLFAGELTLFKPRQTALIAIPNLIDKVSIETDPIKVLAPAAQQVAIVPPATSEESASPEEQAELPQHLVKIATGSCPVISETPPEPDNQDQIEPDISVKEQKPEISDKPKPKRAKRAEADNVVRVPFCAPESSVLTAVIRRNAGDLAENGRLYFSAVQEALKDAGHVPSRAVLSKVLRKEFGCDPKRDASRKGATYYPITKRGGRLARATA